MLEGITLCQIYFNIYINNKKSNTELDFRIYKSVCNRDDIQQLKNIQS
jgi:hypothetical protein